MSETPMKMYWMGQDIETLSREELIKIIQIMNAQVESTRKILHQTIEVHRLAAIARNRTG